MIKDSDLHMWPKVHLLLVSRPIGRMVADTGKNGDTIKWDSILFWTHAFYNKVVFMVKDKFVNDYHKIGRYCVLKDY